MAFRGPNLDVILPHIASSIAEAMAALHSVQAATIKAKGQSIPRQSNQFQEIRKHLKQYWEGIAMVLKKCHSFAGEVGRLHAASQSSNREELSQLLEELTSNCKRCKDQVQALVEKHKVPMQYYTLYEERFSATLRHPSESKRPRNNLDFDGEESMTKFVDACESVRREIQNLVIFFDDQLEACKRYLSAVQGHSRDVSLQETEQFANGWRHNRDIVLKAYVDILAVCDAIMVPAVGVTLQRTSTADSESRPGGWFDELWKIFVSFLGLQHSTTTA